MTVALILFVVSVVITAAALSALLWRRFAAIPPGPWESAASIAVLSFLVAIAITWALSWGGWVARGPLCAFAIALALPSLIFLYRGRKQEPRPRRGLSLLLPLAPQIGRASCR